MIRLVAHVGVYWCGPDIELGTYRFLWLAHLRARWHLSLHSYRTVSFYCV